MKKIYNILINIRKPKQVVFVIIFILFIFSSFHTVTWFLYTKQILSPKPSIGIGDLARLTCETSSLNKREWIYNLPKQHTQTKDWKGESVDIITIGDSFSRGGGGGTNGFYQDYIESIYNKHVLNILPPNETINYIEMVVAMSKNGMLDELKPKIIIIESIERLAVTRFAIDINWSFNINKNKLLDYHFSNTNNSSIEKFNEKNKYQYLKHKKKNISIINKRNYDCLLNPLYYTFSKYPLDRNNAAYKLNLKKKMFSVKADNKLLITSSDIFSLHLSTDKNIKLMNNNLNQLSNILRKKNITLMFMPVVDKYNIYTPYIINNPFPKSIFFETFDTLDKQYYFINTKKILSKIINKKIDVFFADDTHWNNIASEAIINDIPFNKYFSKSKTTK